MSNPYRISGYVTGAEFYGRERLIAAITGGRGQATYVIGMRQTGKTSLLRQIETLVPSLFLCVQLAGARLSELIGQARDQLEEKQPQYPWLPSPSEVPGGDLIGLLRRLDKAARQAGQTVWVLIDEADGLPFVARDDPELLNRLRGAAQAYIGLKLVLVASKTLSQTYETSRKGMSPFLAGFHLAYLSYLAPAAATALIRRSQSLSPVLVGDPLVAELIERTAGHPLLLQLLCHELFSAGRLCRLQSPAVNKVQNTVNQMGIFDADFQYLSDAERRLLRAVSEAGRATAAELGVIAAASFVHGLTQLGYLRQVDDGYAVGNQFLARWLQSAPWEEASDISDAGTLRVYQPTALREAIDKHFNLEELRTLCDDIGVDFDNLGGEGKEAKARELIAYLERRGELERLIDAIRRQRPGSSESVRYPLRDKPIRYADPSASVAEDEWDALC